MPLNVDRIRQLAEAEDDTIPPLSATQADEAVRLLSSKPARALVADAS